MGVDGKRKENSGLINSFIEIKINNEASIFSSMTMNPKETDFLTMKEGDENDSNNTKFPKIIRPSSSRQWSSTHRNPRIVRVSRAFGGKDRHSKVCTVRGLRDRRIRLSVPTAIQLYDLQDRLGLNQPSKVVDWLIEATKSEIDKLPPLPMLPENFPQFHHHPITIDQSSSASANTHHQSSLSHFLSSNYPFGKDLGLGKENQDQQNQEGFGGFTAQLSAQNLFPLTNNIQSSFANLPFNAYNLHWDPANLSLSQFGGGFSFTNNQTVDDEQQQQSTNILPSNSSQLYFCPSAANIVPSIIPTFPSYMNPSFMDNLHHNQLLPTTLHLINSPMNVNSKSFHSQGNDNNERHDINKRD